MTDAPPNLRFAFNREPRCSWCTRLQLMKDGKHRCMNYGISEGGYLMVYPHISVCDDHCPPGGRSKTESVAVLCNKPATYYTTEFGYGLCEEHTVSYRQDQVVENSAGAEAFCEHVVGWREETKRDREIKRLKTLANELCLLSVDSPKLMEKAREVHSVLEGLLS